MPWTQADLDAVEAQIATLEKRISDGDRTVEYHSLEEQLKLRAAMRAALAPRPMVTYASPRRD